MSIDEGATHTSAPGLPNTPTDRGRFVAGTVLAGRYRIVTLLGRGGMGEVYQADDLTLDQPVALKFLPAAIGLHSRALARFHAEARVARQVSHPSVCRVYDVGEVDGLHFLTMEFIDGEDLGSLLRRIGRLPGDKALQIARQLCAGLAAAHDRGVIHRDLKPANIMIDGRGRARIADFGIAAIAGDVRGRDAVAGTPPYMAPEQLEGADGSVQSDIYALGLVLYETFTGRTAINWRTLADVRQHYASGAALTTPSHWIPDLDPLVERAILRCLETDPSRRPASSVQVAAMLPGGDPLQAALAAGETPSPEMVAAAGSREAVPLRTGAILVATAMVLVLAGAAIRAQVVLAARVPLSLPPEVLAHKAREVLASLGYRTAPQDSAYGFIYDYALVDYDEKSADRAGRWQRLESGRPSAVLFWYRDSPEPLVVPGRDRGAFGRPTHIGPVSPGNPPLDTPGMRLVVLDPAGRLVRFRAVASEYERTAATSTTTDWGPLFRSAEVDPAAFATTDTRWVPPVAADSRAAWSGAYPERPDLGIRLEAGSLHGSITAFETIGPWHPLVRPDEAMVFGQLVGGVIGVTIVGSIIGGSILVWRNLRTGRGDRQGAMRLALLVMGLRLLQWGLESDHVAGIPELLLMSLGIADAVYDAFTVCILYLALEPYIRRRWPQVLIAWNRALSGRLRDPLVGYEILVGAAVAAAAGAMALTIVSWNGEVGTTTLLNALLSVRRVAAFVVESVAQAIFAGIVYAFLMFLLRELLRRDWLAGAVLVAVPLIVGAGIPGMLFTLGSVILLTRFGLMAAMAFGFVNSFLRDSPAFLQWSTWYVGVSVFALGVVLVVAGWAFYVATGATWSRRVPAGRELAR